MESKVCHVDDIKERGMLELNTENRKVLLVKDLTGFYAVSHKCAHCGERLIKGALSSGHIRCPIYGTRFDYKTGDLQEYPGLDSLPKYLARVVNNNDVFVTVDEPDKWKRTKIMTTANDIDDRSFVIIGGGPASLICAETLRQEGFEGQIIILSRESHLAYNRTLLSKKLELRFEDVVLRDVNFYNKYKITNLLNQQVESVDMKRKQVTVQKGMIVKYDKLMLCTGLM